MDANGTRFHLLFGKADWLGRTDAGRAPLSPGGNGEVGDAVSWDDERSELTLLALPFEFKSAVRDRPPSPDDRRGAARDRFGNWFWIDVNTTDILVRSAGSRKTSRFWTTGESATCSREVRLGDFRDVERPREAPPLRLAGLTITEDHYLVVGVADPPGFLVFDLHAGGGPEQFLWPSSVPFAPLDMTARAGGGVWILDKEKDKDTWRIWCLDRHFGVVRRSAAQPAAQPAGGFRAVDGSDANRLPPAPPAGAIRPDDAWPAPANAVSIEALPGGALLILDRPPDGSASTIHYFPRIDGVETAFSLAEWHLPAHDLAFVPAKTNGQSSLIGSIYLAAPSGNQSYEFTLNRTEAGAITIARMPKYFPMRLFEGKGLVAAGGDVYYDFDRTWIPLIEQKRPRHVQAGTVRVEPMDGGVPDCVWHRLFLDGCIPPETSVEIWSRAANDPRDLPSKNWQAEPRPLRRRSGSELPFVTAPAHPDAGTWELLLQQARGQWLELKLVLRGDGRATPRLRALRVYYPRFSYLAHYLPAVYRDDPGSASFLDRFLANLEGLLTSTEDRIAASEVLLDVRSAPAGALEWLASWFGLALDPLWSDEKRRLIIAHAMAFFERRGTIAGLQMALGLTLFDCATPELFTDVQSWRSPGSRIRIVEKFWTREAPAVVFGDPTQLQGPREEPVAKTWTPAEGRDRLRDRYLKYLRSNNVTAEAGTPFPLVAPSDKAAAVLWRRFSRGTIGFVPAIGTVDADLWREFLARRYHGVASFNEAYHPTREGRIRSFDEVEPPSDLPRDGVPLVDWYEFESIILAMHAAAHRFTVLLPMRRANEADSALHTRQLELAKRIVELEKPAHTKFEVRFYWSLFRVGDVRLGRDTVVGLGSRSPDLLTPLVLDAGHLAESYLAPSHPRNVPDRRVIGRGREGKTC